SASATLPSIRHAVLNTSGPCSCTSRFQLVPTALISWQSVKGAYTRLDEDAGGMLPRENACGVPSRGDKHPCLSSSRSRHQPTSKDACRYERSSFTTCPCTLVVAWSPDHATVPTAGLLLGQPQRRPAVGTVGGSGDPPTTAKGVATKADKQG